MLKVIFVLFFAFSAFSQSYQKINDSAKCKKIINEHAKSTTSISADFKEESYSSMLTEVQTAHGQLKYKKSDKIRWEHIAPKKQIVLISGNQIKLFENGKEIKNASANRIAKKVQSLMLQLFNGDFLNEKEFSISYYENSYNYKLILKPKNGRMSNYISKIEMVISKKTLALNQLVLEESESDKIIYTFSTVLFNSTLADSNFTKF